MYSSDFEAKPAVEYQGADSGIGEYTKNLKDFHSQIMDSIEMSLAILSSAPKVTNSVYFCNIFHPDYVYRT